MMQPPPPPPAQNVSAPTEMPNTMPNTMPPTPSTIPPLPQPPSAITPQIDNNQGDMPIVESYDNSPYGNKFGGFSGYMLL
jgi:hypothetical protein